MKALMTCAGMNTELRPFTDMMPKCLLPVKAKPILFHNLEWLQKYDIDEVIITTSYHHNQIELALRKFGSFIVKQRKARDARNPLTNEVVRLKERYIPVFKVSKIFKEYVNNSIIRGF